MPPQPGVFPLPYASTSTHKSRANHTEIHNGTTDIVTSYPPPPHHSIHHPSSSSLLAGPSSRPHGTFLLHLRHVFIHSFVASPGANTDDGKKDRRRKEIVGRLGKEMNDRRDECVSFLCFLLVHQHLNKVGLHPQWAPIRRIDLCTSQRGHATRRTSRNASVIYTSLIPP